MRKQTTCVHGSKDATHSTGAVCTPIYQSATFAHPGVGESTGYDYSRADNPTRTQLERTLAALEGAGGALAFSSGMAALACLTELFSPGDRIIAGEDLYGGSVRLFDRICAKNGVETVYADTRDPSKVLEAITPQTKAVFVETPSNPMMRVSDIAAISELTRPRGILLAVDNTFLTPYFCNPLSLGADVVLHSGSKYLCGHNDTIAGFLASSDADLLERLSFTRKTTGAALAPFDSYLLIRGIKTLALRMERSQESAMRIAGWLQEQPQVRAVHYPGLEDHPSRDVSVRQASGFGGMISFETDSPDTARRILSGVRLILFAESLGGVESLITYPFMQTHADVPEEKRLRLGVNDRLLRLSVGVEDCGDLIEDLRCAMEDTNEIQL